MNDSLCSHCGEVKKLNIHHIDGNHYNDIPENRQPLCPRCHHLAHVELLIKNTGRPGTKPISERVFDMPRVTKEEVKRQYLACFPRV